MRKREVDIDALEGAIQTAESVTEGHPDKVCDQIADAVLDTLLREDPHSRVACEVSATTGLISVFGEMTTEGYCDIPAVVRNTVNAIGYDRAKKGFDGDSCAVVSSIKEQSPDIRRGVDDALEERGRGLQMNLGAGDQGMMFGYACTETESLMPFPITLAHQLTQRMAAVRKSGEAQSFYPDGKSQVTVRFENGQPVHLDTVLISTQHRDQSSLDEVAEEVRRLVLKPILPANLIDEATRYLINPTGRFVIGGPAGDSGLTGRKIIADTYGGRAHHGGGAFSGKDPTKVDRSGAYAARYVAKNLVAAGLAERCEVSLAYAIGVAAPVSLQVNSFGSGRYSDERLTALTRRCFDLRPQAIIERFDLLRPIYQAISCYGHFGRPDLDLPWERLDAVEELRTKA